MVRGHTLSPICATGMADTPPKTAPLRLLGFGKHAHVAAAVQERLTSLGHDAHCFVATDDEAGDEVLRQHLSSDQSDRDPLTRPPAQG
ncbi:hypothetical protein WJX72_004783 [[Myrmecia] bisecta]|uniref:Uncharacterized protein n=1 Tax=[Myrmecia] bisecta TaxID=41462 RepID=A0AAW1PNJ1_9CHLO